MPQLLANISLDCHFARFIAGLAANDGEEVYLAALLTSLVTREGDICLRLEEWAGRQFQLIDGRILQALDLEGWLDKLRDSPVVGIATGSAPLVLEDDRLYLSRYWEYEESVAAFLRQRGMALDCPVDRQILAEGLAGLFPKGKDEAGPDWQRLAGLAVLLRPLVVITGGPGTGKTTTVALVLALLGEQYRLRGERLRVALAAPTGKAAMRLQETVARLKGQGQLPLGWGESIPDQVMTIHRLLGVVAGSPFFRYNEDNPLPYDLLVVDEASMVDLPLMAKLFGALSPATRLLLLGDRHQLASVEPGSVLGDICEPSGLATFTQAFVDEARQLGEAIVPRPGRPGPGRFCDSLVELQGSRRFDSGRGIAILSRAIRDGDFTGAWECLQDPAYPEVVWREVAGPEQLDGWLAELVAAGGFAWLSGRHPAQILAESGRYRVLCALRQGGMGAEQVNRRLQEFLTVGAEGGNPPGCPIMVLRNDYELQLYNGDTGIIWPATEAGAARRAYFPGPAGNLREISPSRLPEHQVAFAMTVHKSQGSEFSRIALVLPGNFSPVLSRELLFTAVTRARDEVTICGTPEILARAVATVTERRSGLRQKLWA
jgi:exodeoxyribonuclease V alpha subunit